MDRKPVVLFVNHRQENCGVFQFFKRLTQPVVHSSDTIYYIEVNDESEHDYWRDVLNPAIIVYNFYVSGATMPWLSNDKIGQQRARYKQLCIFHEGNIDDKGFDLILHQNPMNTDTRYHNLSRQIPEYTAPVISHTLPVIGTFGFGLGGKGFTRVVQQTVSEFDEAVIRMNIPFAYFGDYTGDGARWWADACRQIAAPYPRIRLDIQHTLLPEEQLLDFLAANTINCFFYDDNYGRGISGTLDYALAVRRPIAITKSWQFEHMWNDAIILTPKNDLRRIMSIGTDHLEYYHQQWNNKAVIDSFNEAFRKVLPHAI